jgi:hypothetical protein
MDANADLKAGVTLTPERSQVFIVAMLVLAGIALVAGLVFLWYKPEICWVPFSFALLFAGVASIGWFRSHSNVDLHGAAPTTVSSSENGAIQLSTDLRTLLTPEALIGLTQVVELITYRQPIPEPDGLVGKGGIPIPLSKEQAVSRVHAVNVEAVGLAQRVVGPYASLRDSTLLDQSMIDPSAGVGELITSNVVIGT